MKRPTFRLTLRLEPQVADVDRALRHALKALLRRFGLRCIAIEPRPPPPGAGAATTSSCTETKEPRP
jgi:hypothetical protein